MSGQAADAPALQKNKAIIDSEAKVLDRMLGVDGAWPFKWVIDNMNYKKLYESWQRYLDEAEMFRLQLQ